MDLAIQGISQWAHIARVSCEVLREPYLLLFRTLLRARRQSRSGRKKRLSGHGQAVRPRERKEAVLHFCPLITTARSRSNTSGRNLRTTKLGTKLAGGYQSERRVEGFAATCRRLSIARKQSRKCLDRLQQGPIMLLAGRQS